MKLLSPMGYKYQMTLRFLFIFSSVLRVWIWDQPTPSLVSAIIGTQVSACALAAIQKTRNLRQIRY
jgi:hypothetical protein